MAAPQDKNSVNTSSWRFALRALSHRNYRLFFSGQSISLIGTWMTRLATSWLVYQLTNSAFLLGFIGFAGQVPVFILYWTAFAGADGQMNFRSDPYNWDRELLQRVGVLAAATKA